MTETSADARNRHQKVADAAPGNWVDHYAPRALRPYLRLMRADRPIGVWLLLWPCWWGIALATTTVSPMTAPTQAQTFGYELTMPNVWLLVLFAIGAYVMRGAGCTLNDLVDRKIDAAVERTRSRPIPSGQVSPEAAFVFLGFQCLAGLIVLLQLNTVSIVLGASSLILVAIYPFMKRFTYWPQLFLGLAFNWGALLGWSAVTGSLSAVPVLLYAAGIMWTIGYDTIYAHQDKEDDVLVGVKSTALKFGSQSRFYVALFYMMSLALIALSGYLAQLPPLFFAALAISGLQLLWQIYRLEIDNPDRCLDLFRSNKSFGLLVFISILIGIYAG